MNSHGSSTLALAEHVFKIRRPHPRLLVLYLLRSLTALMAMPLVFVPLYFKYHTLRYHFDERGLRMQWGILFRKEIYLTYGRIQDIHVSSGLVERWLGLGSIAIQTASGQQSAEVTIVGLTEYLQVRDFLYSMMRGVQDGPRQRGRSEALELLASIRDELRALNAARGGSGASDV